MIMTINNSLYLFICIQKFFDFIAYIAKPFLQIVTDGVARPNQITQNNIERRDGALAFLYLPIYKAVETLRVNSTIFCKIPILVFVIFTQYPNRFVEEPSNGWDQFLAD